MQTITITITLTLEELMLMPGDGIMRILTKAKPPVEFLRACHDHENRPLHGKGRWPVNNHLRQLIAKADT
jgi:hypothetical protein